MRFFDKNLSLLLLLFSIPLLFLPKINLVKIGSLSETAGLRIDDFILVFLAVLFGWAHTLLNKKLYKLEGWIFVLTLFSVFSFISNYFLVSAGVLQNRAPIFYSFRILEYFIFFYVGAITAEFFPKNKVIPLFFLWNILWILLQKFSLIGGVTSSGYVDDVSNRVQGVASFPSEMGLLLNLLYCYLIYNHASLSHLSSLFPFSWREFFKKFYIYWISLFFILLIIWTGNRISIMAFLVCFLFKLKNDRIFQSVSSMILALTIIPMLFLASFFIITSTESVSQRSAGLLTWKNVDAVAKAWDIIDVTPKTSQEGNLNADSAPQNIEEGSLHYDMSWIIRAYKWVYILKTYFSNPICYLQGVGPGFAGPALDGGFVRIMTEYGILGCLIFWKIFSTIAKINKQLKWMVIAFLFNMIFFDAYLAYKTMSLLFFAAGQAQILCEEDRRIAQNKKNPIQALT